MSISNLQILLKGQLTCDGTTPVVVPLPINLNSNTIIKLSPSDTDAATEANKPSISAISSNSFTIVCGGANDKVYNYLIMN